MSAGAGFPYDVFMIRDPGRLFRSLARRYSTPRKVQGLLRTLSYNKETGGDTLRSAHQTWLKKTAHCLEGALLAAAILEHQGYEPRVLSMESADNLDHVVFIFKARTGWGAVGQSNFEGLHGREPRFRTLRDLAYSYFDPFIDLTGRVTAYAGASLDDSRAPWRDSARNVWAVEDFLIELKHTPLKGSETRYLKGLEYFKRTGNSGEPQSYWW